ncbi:hypothetical protein X566_01520 [Afipia sp. P52-10]|uniref:phage tail terminator protein n=1 Tax=Afipia sp. P52-10 TaxID=1429916 RepID=UPI0003DF47D8|nr:hypothetical protein [Afipia sp. P52-10]ETR79328.1 hypothetical protein X566_01520 [Afipia sp. P52-10]
MSLIDAVRDRLHAEVPALKDRVELIAALAALVEQGGLPQREVTAYVVPLGFDDRGGDSMGHLHTQMLSESIGVVLCVKALGDAAAKRALPTIDTLKDGVISALAGWGPDTVSGVLRATRGRLLAVANGLVTYQIDFAVLDQLRIAR